MIWLRRVLAIPLIIIFVLTFVLGLVLCHLSGTVGSAGFYNGQMRKAHVYDWVYDDLMPVVLDEIEVESPTDFPIDTPELKEDIISVAEQTFPRKWLQSTFENATRQIVPYVVGDKNSFTITVDVRSRIDPMAEGIKDVVDEHRQVIYDYMTEDLIAPAVTESLGTTTTLSYGVSLTDAEISAAIKAAMPQDWTITQFKNIVDAVADYLKGDSSSLNLTLSLTSIKAAAAASLSELADDKLETAFNGLPACDLATFNACLLSLPANTLPSCRPGGYSYEQFKSALQTKWGTTIPQAVNEAVMSDVPDTWQFDDAQLREALGEDMAGALDSAREFIVDKDGQITDEELREKDNGSNDAEEEGFDQARSTIHTIKMWIWALWFVSILLLVGIGFLCGRNWKSRLLWPLCVLFVTCLIFVIVVAVALAVAPIPDRIVERPEGSDATQVEILIADKADEVAHNAINTLVWGLELKLILFIVFSGLAIAGVIAWAIVDRRRRQRLTQYDPTGPPP